jgi:hypothetical protein
MTRLRAELSEKIRELRGDDAIRFIGWPANSLLNEWEDATVAEEAANYIEWLEAQPKKP